MAKEKTISRKAEPIKGPIVLPGIDGRRFRLRAGQELPLLKKDDPLQPEPVADARVKIFDCSKQEDLSEYARVWDDAAKGDVMISAEERHWCDETQNFKIFLRWGEVYMEMPKAYGRSTSNGQIYE